MASDENCAVNRGLTPGSSLLHDFAGGVRGRVIATGVRCGQCLAQEAVEGRVRVGRFLAATKDDGVAALHAQRGRVQGDVGPRFVNEEDDAERDTYFVDVQTVGPNASVEHPTDRRAPLRGVRRAMARNLADAWREVPHISLFDELDARPLLAAHAILSGTALASRRIRLATGGPLNDLWRAYGGFDMERGTFGFYSELQVREGQVDGYVKPIFRDLKIMSPDEKKRLPEKIYEGIVAGAGKILTNPPRDQIATKTDLSGPLENPQASILQITGNLVRNAFFKAILPGLERWRKRPE